MAMVGAARKRKEESKARKKAAVTAALQRT
jgi:hypothetical protein